ncbi:hypothetical protein SBDP1_1020024 [Syntrophobacter sp. SbD1]|nr:hypothetical protein SBDP1_1020024 [Syntrophobacter sp. SbD1]
MCAKCTKAVRAKMNRANETLRQRETAVFLFEGGSTFNSNFSASPLKQ